jgi:hypothetical protein
MKKIIIASFFLVSLIGCKKDYTCVCQVTDEDGWEIETTETFKAKSKDAEQKCEDSAGQIKVEGTVCKLK